MRTMANFIYVRERDDGRLIDSELERPISLTTVAIPSMLEREMVVDNLTES